MNVTPLSSCEAKLPLRLLYAGIDGINLTRFECLNIGVGRFRILGGGQGLEYWGGGGDKVGPNSQHRRHFDVVCPQGFQ